jgi:hypothetical protein
LLLVLPRTRRRRRGCGCVVRIVFCGRPRDDDKEEEAVPLVTALAFDALDSMDNSMTTTVIYEIERNEQ